MREGVAGGGGGLALAVAIGIATTAMAIAACGGRVGEAPATGDGATDDGSLGADAGSSDAGVARTLDATSGPDAAAPVDAPEPDGESPRPDGPPDDAPDDAPSWGDGASDAGDDASHAAYDAAPDAESAPRDCNDECEPGNMQCTWTPYIGTPDGGYSGGVKGVAACIVGDAGCAVWGPQAACTAGYGCCVGCQLGACPDGSPDGCVVCPVGPAGSACTLDAQCDSNACDGRSSTCVGNQCNDHRQDGTESDVDCGGDTCLPCASGLRCEFNSDCQTSLCSNHTCF
jgi:hypothetical protein